MVNISFSYDHQGKRSELGWNFTQITAQKVKFSCGIRAETVSGRQDTDYITGTPLISAAVLHWNFQMKILLCVWGRLENILKMTILTKLLYVLLMCMSTFSVPHCNSHAWEGWPGYFCLWPKQIMCNEALSGINIMVVFKDTVMFLWQYFKKICSKNSGWWST